MTYPDIYDLEEVFSEDISYLPVLAFTWVLLVIVSDVLLHPPMLPVDLC